MNIIVNADDLGLSPSVNTAIFDVYQAGNLSSATLMVAMPGTRDAVDRLAAFPGLAVGLHFCITEGLAVAGPSTLTDGAGRFMPRGKLIKAVLSGKVSGADVAAEFAAQLGLMHGMGLRPTHSDSHQHVHMIPLVRDAILPLIAREGIGMRIVAPPPKARSLSLRRPVKSLKQHLNHWLAQGARKRSTQPSTDLLVSVHDLDSLGPYGASTYQGLLRGLPSQSTVEVMVHPYILGDDVLSLYADMLEAKRPFLQRCEAEYKALSGPPVFGAETLIGYHQLGR